MLSCSLPLGCSILFMLAAARTLDALMLAAARMLDALMLAAARMLDALMLAAARMLDSLHARCRSDARFSSCSLPSAPSFLVARSHI